MRNDQAVSFSIGGVPVDALTMEEAYAALSRLIHSRHGAGVHFVNSYTVSVAARERSYCERLQTGNLNLADGAPLSWMSRRLGLHGGGRVAGPDFMAFVMDRGRAADLRHYLYGSTPNVLRLLSSRLQHQYPDLRIVGIESPPFRGLTHNEGRAFVDRVRASAADVVWVALGTPQQDVFVEFHKEAAGCPLVAVGAAFDFISGTKGRPHTLVQRAGFEWAYRLITEPRRLWRRYLYGHPKFIQQVVCRNFRVLAPSERRLP